jgi:hypothetical protein
LGLVSQEELKEFKGEENEKEGAHSVLERFPDFDSVERPFKV